jgi:hypothetical protein
VVRQGGAGRVGEPADAPVGRAKQALTSVPKGTKSSATEAPRASAKETTAARVLTRPSFRFCFRWLSFMSTWYHTNV